MNLDRIRLAKILDTLKLTQGNKVMEVSFYVKFVVDVENHAVYLGTTDFHSFLVIDFGDVALTNLDDVPGEFLIKFKQLHDLVKASTTEDVGFTHVTGNDWIRVVTNGSFEFPVYKEISQFPTADFKHEPAGEWDVPELSDIWEKVSTVVSKDVTKLSYQGVNYDGNWCASDNRRFAMVMGGEDHKYEGDSMLIPTVFGDILSRCSGTVSMGKNNMGNMLVINNPESGLVGAMRLLDAKFVQYERVLEMRSPHIKMVMPKQFLLGTLRRLQCFTDKIFKVGIFTITRSAEGATLRCQIEHDANTGDETLDAMDFEFDGELPEVGEVAQFQYQIDNLATGINAVDSQEEVSISFQQDGKLWIDEGGFHYLLSRISS